LKKKQSCLGPSNRPLYCLLIFYLWCCVYVNIQLYIRIYIAS